MREGAVVRRQDDVRVAALLDGRRIGQAAPGAAASAAIGSSTGPSGAGAAVQVSLVGRRCPVEVLAGQAGPGAARTAGRPQAGCGHRVRCPWRRRAPCEPRARALAAPRARALPRRPPQPRRRLAALDGRRGARQRGRHQGGRQPPALLGARDAWPPVGAKRARFAARGRHRQPRAAALLAALAALRGHRAISRQRAPPRCPPCSPRLRHRRASISRSIRRRRAGCTRRAAGRPTRGARGRSARPPATASAALGTSLCRLRACPPLPSKPCSSTCETVTPACRMGRS